MVRNPFRTLRGRLATTYACLALIGVAASAVYTANTLRSGLRDRVGLDLADQARLLSAAVSEPLAHGDRPAIENYVGAGATMVAAFSAFLLATSVARPAGQVAQAALHLANRRPAGLPFGPQATSAFP